MYHYTVHIPNPPLDITRHFTFTEVQAANDFAHWLREQGIEYSTRYEPQDFLTHAIAAVDKERALAAQGRVE